jgi:hypothetical protein
MSKRLVALIIFKETQAWALRSVGKLAARVRAFLECSPAEPAKPKDTPLDVNEPDLAGSNGQR